MIRKQIKLEDGLQHLYLTNVAVQQLIAYGS